MSEREPDRQSGIGEVVTFLPITDDEMLEDEAQLRSYLDGRLRVFDEHA